MPSIKNKIKGNLYEQEVYISNTFFRQVCMKTSISLPLICELVLSEIQNKRLKLSAL